ncbi:Hypothetical predicted protein, partial [Marmota monax]
MDSSQKVSTYKQLPGVSTASPLVSASGGSRCQRLTTMGSKSSDAGWLSTVYPSHRDSTSVIYISLIGGFCAADSLHPQAPQVQVATKCFDMTAPKSPSRGQQAPAIHCHGHQELRC